MKFDFEISGADCSCVEIIFKIQNHFMFKVCVSWPKSNLELYLETKRKIQV